MTDREREARIRGRLRSVVEDRDPRAHDLSEWSDLQLVACLQDTSWEEVSVEVLRRLAGVERYREALGEAIAHHEEQASAWNGAYELTGEQALKVDYHRDRAAELRRSLNDGEDDGDTV